MSKFIRILLDKLTLGWLFREHQGKIDTLILYAISLANEINKQAEVIAQLEASIVEGQFATGLLDSEDEYGIGFGEAGEA